MQNPAATQNMSEIWQKIDVFYSCYLRNAYRVLGLTGASSQAELKKTLADIRRQAKIGKAYTSAVDLAWVGPAISRSERDLLDAETKLLNPETRIQQRLLWFHAPPEAIPGDLNPERAATMALKWAESKDPIQLHDAAVLMQFAAMAESPEFERQDYWLQAGSLWNAVLANEDYWSFLCELDEKLGYEPVCLSSDVYALRDRFIELLTEPIVLMSKDALNRGNQQLFARAAALLNANSAASDETATGKAASSEITDEFFRMLHSVSHEIGATIEKKIDRNEKSYKSHRQQTIDVCGQMESIFKFEIEPILENARSVLSESDPSLSELREVAASTLETIGNSYTWADDYVNTIRVLEQALSISEGTAVEPKIRESLDNAQKNLDMQKMFGEQKRVNSAPILFTMNTCGFTIYPAIGEQAEPNLGSKRAIYYFVLAMLPIFPLASYRVIFNQNGSYNFISRIPLDKFARLHQAAIALMIFMCFWSAAHPDPADVARRNAEIARNTDMAIARAKQPVPLPQEKRDLKDLISSDDQALSDLEGRIKQVRPVLEQKKNELTASVARLKALSSAKKISEAELKALAEAHNKKADEMDKLGASYNVTVETAEKILKERNDAAAKYNELYVRH